MGKWLYLKGNDPIEGTHFSLNHVYGRKGIPPQSLTGNLKISPWKRRFLLETIIFRFHVELGVCNIFVLYATVFWHSHMLKF